MRGWGRVRWGLEKFFLYESKFKIIPVGWKRRGWDMAKVSDCFFFLNKPSVKKIFFFSFGGDEGKGGLASVSEFVYK